MAITTDGSILVNAIAFVAGDDLDAIIKAAGMRGGPVFVGVVLTDDEAKRAGTLIDDAAAEIAARVANKRIL